MAMLTTEEVIRELEGEDESGCRTLLTMDDINKVRSRFKDYAFIYSKREGGHTACSGCGGLLERTVERRGDSIFCPRCRKTVRAYEEWRGHKHLYEQVMVYIWKRSRQDPETILAKAIYAEKYFGFQNPEDTPLGARVAALYQFGPKGAKKYTASLYNNGIYPNTSSITPEENKHGYKCDGLHDGFWNAAEGTELGSCADALHVRLTEGQRGMHPVLALTEAARKPYLKHVILQGQEQLAREMVQGLFKPKKRTAKTMPALLGLTEGQWYEVRKGGHTLTAQWLNALHDIQTAGNMVITLKEAWTAVENNSSYIRSRLRDEAPVRLAGCTPKLRRKAVRKAAFSRDLPEWLDYWGQLAKLGEDMTEARVLLPKDLHAMHQRMTERVNALREEQRWQKDAAAIAEFDSRMAKLRKEYCFEACGLILRPFESAEEVIAEGVAQHICIGGYADRYLKGETILCALRRAEAPEEPWRAVEFSVRTGHMVQDRGRYNDRGMGADNMKNGVEGWLKRFWAAFERYRLDMQINEKARKAA